MHKKSNTQIVFVGAFVMILGVRGPPGGSFEKGTKKDIKNGLDLTRGPPVWEAIFANFLPKIGFVGICLVSIFMLVFGIAFGEPPAPIW